MEKTPADVGFPAHMNWNSPLVRDWIEQQWEVVYQPRAVRQILHRLGLSFTKSTYTLAKAVPIQQEVFWTRTFIMPTPFSWPLTPSLRRPGSKGAKK